MISSIGYPLKFGWVGLLFAVVLAGCASPANREAMVPSQIVVGKQHPYSIQVTTSGGSETGLIDSSNISDADLKAAIETAIARDKLFKAVLQGAGGDYELTVRIVALSKPLFGGTFTVDLETAWSLVRLADRKVVMRKSVTGKGVATMSEEFAGVARLRLAVEKAARENIAQGLQEIAKLNL